MNNGTRGEALLASGSIGRPGWASLRRSLALRGFIVSALANARAGSAEAEQLEHLSTVRVKCVYKEKRKENASISD